ncbi:MAG: phosphate ABC transporter substrate-binding protein [Gammaproteobacteria bacterium]|nr:phosphate ABC transporter substrate-binding protein [Gammaproteobacteria bacterium]
MKNLLQTLVLVSAMSAGLADAGVVLVGNPAIGGTLTADQASALYLGKGNKLPNGSPAVVYELENGNALRVDFHDKVTGKSEAQLQSYWSRLVFTGKGSPPTQLANTGLMKSTIASTPNAVGYIDESEVDASVIVLLKP